VSYDPRNHAATWADAVAGIVIYLIAVAAIAARAPLPPVLGDKARPVLVSDLHATPNTCPPIGATAAK
jgi:hypothetical protein